jgi:hypothetical protein
MENEINSLQYELNLLNESLVKYEETQIHKRRIINSKNTFRK